MSDTLQSLFVLDDLSARDLTRLLEPIVSRLRDLGVQPALIAEAPHKFNDADYDDYWCAVQVGASYWEQAQFFENTEHQRITENASFVPDKVMDPQGPGTAIASEKIQFLRSTLRQVQTLDWRSAIASTFSAPRNLLSLILEHGQPWLCLEEVNGAGDGDTFAWDHDGLFYVGTMSRLDQAIGRPQVLVFETIDNESLHRLGESALSYFRPRLANRDAEGRLRSLLLRAAAIVRAATDRPVALKASGSRSGPGDLNRSPSWARPESAADNLRQGEGHYRVAKDGAWPPLMLGLPPQRHELSTAAKAYNQALKVLEDGGWRAEFGSAIGASMAHGETLAFFVDPERAVLARDNSYFKVSDTGVDFLGSFDYASVWDPADILNNLPDG